MVGDIYGSDYPKIGLKATTIASSFGKLFKRKRVQPKKQDICRSLVYAIRYRFLSHFLCRSRLKEIIVTILARLPISMPYNTASTIFISVVTFVAAIPWRWTRYPMPSTFGVKAKCRLIFCDTKGIHFSISLFVARDWRSACSYLGALGSFLQHYPVSIPNNLETKHLERSASIDNSTLPIHGVTIESQAPSS